MPSRPVFIDRHAATNDAVVSFEIVNRTSTRVRVVDVDIGYGGVSVDLEPVAGDDRRGVRLDPGERKPWRGVCLSGVPPATSAATIEVRYTTPDETGNGLGTATVALSDPPPAPAMRLPFDGYWRVTQGHGCGSAHRSGGRGGEFAWDFAAVERGNRGREASPGFGRVVLAPVSGRLVKAVDDVEDNPASREYPRRSLLEDLSRPAWIFGNHVVIEAGDGAYVLLAHLERRSLLKAAGDAVRAGEPIARVGNSGNTRQPHLHVQVMDRPDPGDPEVRGLPASFDAYVEITAASAEDESEILVQRVSRGAPEEGAVVTPAP